MADFNKPLSSVPDAEDLEIHALNSDTDLITERLGELVPLLKFVGFKVDLATPSKTVLTVPLLETAMNQNGTHQAAVFYLLADYALGVAMFAALPGIYTVGVHDRCHAMPIQFWLKGAQVKHLAPGTGAIRAEVSLAPEVVETMRQSMVAKGRYLLKHPVNIYQGDHLVAVTEHEMGIYADLPRAAERKASINQIERMKISALMIAGLRGDDLSRGLAGEQGIAVASRMTRATPQLPTLVQSRMAHTRQELSEKTYAQVLVLGAGLDPKPIDFASEKQIWFLADLPEMLNDRDARLSKLGVETTNTVRIPLDLRISDWSMKVQAAGFDPSKASLVIFEGVSMYLGSDELQQVLSEIWKLCQNPDSRLWLDHVTDAIFETDNPEVTSFLRAMARLGEPFVTGFANAVEFSATGRWNVDGSVSAAQVLQITESVHEEYRFSILRPLVAA